MATQQASSSPDGESGTRGRDTGGEADLDPLDFGATLRGLRAGTKVFQRYRLERQLGRGGMGVVWLARDQKLDLEVALKFLPDHLVHDEVALDDLRRETRRCMRLTHQHIVRVFDLVDDPHTAAIAMEFVEGKSLSALRLDRPNRVFTVEEAGPWVRQMCEALAYAHESGRIVHRDLKPSNLMLDANGMVKVVDFGIASSIGDSMSRVSKADRVLSSGGTLPYMSPQQVMGYPPSVADDVYAIGATLYELLTSKPPFFRGSLESQIQSITPPSIRERRQELDIPGEAVPETWERVVAACLQKEATVRPKSAMAVWQALAGEPKARPVRLREMVDVRPEPRKEEKAPRVVWRPQRRTVVAVTTALVLVTGSASGLYFVGIIPGTERYEERQKMLSEVAKQKQMERDALAVQRAQEQADANKLTELKSDLEDERQLDQVAPGSVATWEGRVKAWEAVVAKHDLADKPAIPAFDEALNEVRKAWKSAKQRLASEQTALAQMTQAEKQQQAERTQIGELDTELQRETQSDAKAEATRVAWETRAKAWETLIKKHDVKGQPEAVQFKTLLAQAQGALTQAHAKLQSEIERETNERLKMAKLWESKQRGEWANLKTYCDDSTKGARGKVDRLSTYLAGLTPAPVGAEKTMDELKREVGAELLAWKQTAEMETPKSPLSRTELFAQSPYKGVSDNVLAVLLKKVQAELARRAQPDGARFYLGTPDGTVGPMTHNAIVAFQDSQQLPATAALDEATLRALGLGNQDIQALETESKILLAEKQVGPIKSAQKSGAGKKVGPSSPRPDRVEQPVVTVPAAETTKKKSNYRTGLERP
jgi:serine/threonine protein kinase/peptidoglycan hydrolase-like protein with peptidoglycan-binding domain